MLVLLFSPFATWAGTIVQMTALRLTPCWRQLKWAPWAVSLDLCWVHRDPETPGFPLYLCLSVSPGTAGLIYGGAAGVIRSPNPVIHSISCGIHWFACGSTFWCMFMLSPLSGQPLILHVQGCEAISSSFTSKTKHPHKNARTWALSPEEFLADLLLGSWVSMISQI